MLILTTLSRNRRFSRGVSSSCLCGFLSSGRNVRRDGAARQGHALGEQTSKIRFGKRPGKQVALHFACAEAFEDRQFFLGFNTFHNAGNAHVPAEGQQGFDDAISCCVRPNTVDENAIDLDAIERQLVGMSEA